MIDIQIHVRKGRTARALCGATTGRVETRRDFDDMSTWDLTHKGLRICEACERAQEVQDAK